MPESQITKNHNPRWPRLWGRRVSIMGIINVTPDSFSDGGLYLNPEDACKRALASIDSGADVIDIGAQSTRPGASYLDSEKELERLIPALKAIRESFPEIIISVDTFHSKVAEKSLELGADWINDISGGRIDNNMTRVLAGSDIPFVVTHSRGNSQTMTQLSEYQNVVNDVLNELYILTEKAIHSGLKSTQIIWDPGLGFAKNDNDNLLILKSLERFTKSEFPILLGPSRKRFIGYVLKESDPNKRLLGTAAVICRCVSAKVNMVRVHDVFEISKVISIANEIW